MRNKFVHLTNNAVQKHSTNYGTFEDGNQLSYNDFRVHLEVEMQQDGQVINRILEKFKEIIVISLKAVKSKVNRLKRKNCFEILGYDFIIDKELQPWLIETNTNPCIEESSNLLK